jgi:hypothetical protein
MHRSLALCFKIADEAEKQKPQKVHRIIEVSGQLNDDDGQEMWLPAPRGQELPSGHSRPQISGSHTPESGNYLAPSAISKLHFWR